MHYISSFCLLSYYSVLNCLVRSPIRVLSGPEVCHGTHKILVFDIFREKNFVLIEFSESSQMTLDPSLLCHCGTGYTHFQIELNPTMPLTSAIMQHLSSHVSCHVTCY